VPNASSNWALATRQMGEHIPDSTKYHLPKSNGPAEQNHLRPCQAKIGPIDWHIVFFQTEIFNPQTQFF
jgi:hypothetical protein